MKVMKNWSEHLEGKDPEWMSDVYLSRDDVENLQIQMRERRDIYDEDSIWYEEMYCMLDTMLELYDKDDLTDEECKLMDSLMFDFYAYSK